MSTELKVPDDFEYLDLTFEQKSIYKLKKNLMAKIDSHFKTEFRVEFEMATFLDPGYKKHVTRDLLNDIKNFALKYNLADEIYEVILNSLVI